MTPREQPAVAARPCTGLPTAGTGGAAPGRNRLGHRHVCIDFSPGARGLFLGVDLAPLPARGGRRPSPDAPPDVPRMVAELQDTLGIVHSERLRSLPGYAGLPPDLRVLRHVALGGRSDPTASPVFLEALEAIIHLRAVRRFPFFKLILETDAGSLQRPGVPEGLGLLTAHDEVWARLDPDASAPRTHPRGGPAEAPPGLLRLTHQRPVVLQGCFSARDGEVPTPRSVEAFARRLRSLKDAGAQIPRVHIHTESKATARPHRTPLPLRTLFQIARQVRAGSGLAVEVS